VLNLGVNRIFKVEFKKLWILVSTICKAARHSTIAQKLTNIHNDLKQKEKENNTPKKIDAKRFMLHMLQTKLAG